MEGDRIRELRKEYLHLSQGEFGTRLGVKKVAISLIESGRNKVTTQMRSAICREYNVSKEWLLTGEGEMFKPVASDEVDALVQKYNLDDKARAIIEKFIVLKPSEQETILDFVASVSKEMLKSEEKKK